MSRKSKGIDAERELVHLFWKHRWAAVRVAGSGSSRYPSPDIVAGNSIRKIAVECKVCSENRKYISIDDIEDLQEYCTLFGAEMWIAVKFSSVKNWFFLMIEDLEMTDKNYVISLENSKNKGLLFEEVIGQF